MAGRGFGKTRTGAEWVRSLVENNLASRIALIGPTAADVRDVMIEGESGLLNVFPPDQRPDYQRSNRKVVFSNGAVAMAFSAERPERLRGPQHDAAWCDELCAWQYGQETWDQLQFGLRLGTNPRTCITTTPKPTKLLKEIMADVYTVITRGTTYDNLANLAGTFARQIVGKYEGTRLGRQELNAEILNDVAGALWTRDNIEQYRKSYAQMPGFERIVVAVDPPVTSGAKADECGCIVAGISGGRGHILADHSSQGLTPKGWATKAIEAYHEFQADAIVVEVNNGGEMIRSLILQIDAGVRVKEVRATRGKAIRAEPVAALYEQGKVCHMGTMPTLEDQMCAFTIDFDRKEMGYSPDRVDALVWAATDLFNLGEKAKAKPNIRRL